jgi:uncharacterized membrane protein
MATSQLVRQPEKCMKQESSRESPIAVLLPLSLMLGLVLLLSLNPGQSERSAAVVSPLEEWLKVIIGYLAAGAEIAAAIAIGGAIARGISSYIRQFCSRRQHFDAIQLIRLQLGQALALGLEFTVASDILRTTVAPTRQDILNLGAIVFLRTLLNYFLEREIDRGEQSPVREQPIEIEE